MFKRIGSKLRDLGTSMWSNIGGAGLIPGRGAKIIYASWPKKLKHKTETTVTNSIKDFKNGLH